MAGPGQSLDAVPELLDPRARAVSDIESTARKMLTAGEAKLRADSNTGRLAARNPAALAAV